MIAIYSWISGWTKKTEREKFSGRNLPFLRFSNGLVPSFFFIADGLFN
jgi:hypothetical protein